MLFARLRANLLLPAAQIVFIHTLFAQDSLHADNAAHALRIEFSQLAALDENLVSHPFTAESAADGLLSALVRDSDPTLWRYVTTPFSMNVNLKITKKLYRDKMAVALFVNKLLDYTPDYHTSDGRHIRREVTPYFGMELNIKL